MNTIKDLSTVEIKAMLFDYLSEIEKFSYAVNKLKLELKERLEKVEVANDNKAD
jgi:hypothetical protein